LLSLAATVGLFLISQATPDIPGGDDGYRHVKFAYRLIRDPHDALSDPWKVLYHWPKPMDAWFGYHLLLAPLTLALGLIASAKVLAAAVYGALAFVLLTALRYLDVLWRKAWVILAISGSGIVLYRYTLGRPFLLSIVLVLAVTYFTLQEKPLAVAMMSAAHGLSYSMFFMAAFAPAMYLLIRRDKTALKLLSASLAGIALGLACNPTAPENVRYDVMDFFSTLTLGLRLTMEVEPLNMEWINPSLIILVLWLFSLGLAVWRWRTERLPAGTQLLLAMSLAGFVASIRVGRMFDYFVPISALSAAAVVSPWIVRSSRRRVDAAAATTVLLVLCGLNVAAVYRVLPGTPAASRFRGASKYLLEHGRGALVFNTQWEQYPFLYFWNSQSTYLIGIEPSIMFVRDARRYWLWRHIANDESRTCGVPKCTVQNSQSIGSTLTEFGAGFVIVEHNRNARLSEILHNTPDTTEVYHDAACSVFRIEPAVFETRSIATSQAPQTIP
jgi:hypothetical protein